MMAAHGLVTSRAIEGVPDPEGKFQMYANYSEPATKIPSHRMLAIRRGAKEGILTFEIELDRVQPLNWLRTQVVRAPGEWVPHLEEAIEDSYDRLLNPSIQTEVRLELKDRSDEEAIKVFRENLENLLLSPPAGMMTRVGARPRHPHRLQNRGGGRYRQVPRKLRHLPLRAEERPRRQRPHPRLAGGAPQRPGHRHRQWHGLARKRRLRAGLPPPGEPHQNLQRDRERIRRQRLLGDRDRAPGVPRSRPHRSRRHLDRAPPAGPARRTGEDRSQIDRRRAVPARCRSAPPQAEPRSHRRKLREPRRRRSEHRLLGAAALRRRHQRAHRAEDRRVP